MQWGLYKMGQIMQHHNHEKQGRTAPQPEDRHIVKKKTSTKKY